MKKILTMCCCVGVGLMVHGNAMAIALDNKLCIAQVCALGSQVANFVPRNCKTYWEYCYNGYQVYECTECNSGYTLQNALSPITVTGCMNTIDPMQCVADCVETDCDDENWTTLQTGYQVYKTKTWDSTACECTTTESYQCAAGYYGTATCSKFAAGFDLCFGCSKCPSGGVYTDSELTTAATPGCLPGNGTTETSCYLAPGTYYDASGAFTISGGFVTSCTYSE